LQTISGEFNSQAVANTLWAFVMGTKPGERMMGQLERRAEAISACTGKFNSQDTANTLWGADVCDYGDKAGEGLHFFSEEPSLLHMHQFFISWDVQEDLHAALPERCTARHGPVVGGRVPMQRKA
jgi:hypothetical protein